MKHFVIGLTVFSVALAAVASPSEVFLGERIAAIEFEKRSHNTMFGEEACRRPQALLKAVKTLPVMDQSMVRAFVKTYEHQIPEKILLPLVYWKFIKKSPGHETSVLQYWFQKRLQSLRDYADHPLKKDKKAQADARSLLTSWVGTPGSKLTIQSEELILNLSKRFPEMEDYSLSAGGFRTREYC